MKHILLILTAVLSLAGCTTLETASDVDARVAGKVHTDKPVTLMRTDGTRQTVRITEVRSDEITVRHENGDYEELPYSEIESMEYTRLDRGKGVLVGIGIGIVAIALMAEAIESSIPPL